MNHKEANCAPLPWHLASAFALVAILLIAVESAPVGADSTFQCQAGPSASVVTACAARWEAANTRAHIAVNSLGGQSTSCLTATAAAFEQFAMIAIATGRNGQFNGPWPCGGHPGVSSADDGVLARTCPGAAWTYDNRGAPTQCVKLIGTYQCGAGTDAAIVNACSARWEAANIRTHVTAGNYQGASPECLSATATLLEQQADTWAKNDTFTPFAGDWPCGSSPDAFRTDDGLLRSRCPADIWTSENRGDVDCKGSLMRGTLYGGVLLAFRSRAGDRPWLMYQTTSADNQLAFLDASMKLKVVASGKSQFSLVAGGQAGVAWVADRNENDRGFSHVGRVTSDGSISWVNLPLYQSGPVQSGSEERLSIEGPGETIWYNSYGTQIVRWTQASANFTTFYIPQSQSSDTVSGLALGPDGAIWFTVAGAGAKVGRLSVDGQFTVFPLPRLGMQPAGIVTARDGALWFFDRASGALVRITTSGESREISGQRPKGIPTELAAGTDGAIWFGEANAPTLGRITADGSLSEYALPGIRDIKDLVVFEDTLWIAADAANYGSFFVGALPIAPSK